MAMPVLNLTGKPLNLEKLEKKSNVNSLHTFLVFIIMYICAFYMFNLSPSTLMRTTKFWFIISNTLILIIAADSGAFSFSKSLDFSQDYTKNNLRPTPYFQVKYEKKTRSNHHAHRQLLPREKIIGVVASDDRIIPTQKTPRLFITDQSETEAEKRDEKFDENNSTHQFKKVEENEGSLSESREEVVSEENEFSRMSDEEVNRRVEEFIRRFNRQIRLQAVRNRPLA